MTYEIIYVVPAVDNRSGIGVQLIKTITISSELKAENLSPKGIPETATVIHVEPLRA